MTCKLDEGRYLVQVRGTLNNEYLIIVGMEQTDEKSVISLSCGCDGQRLE